MKLTGLRCLVVLAALLAFAGPAGAVIIGLPADSASGNCFPFGCSGRNGSIGTRYQQVYDSAQFSGSLLIDTISFFDTSFPGGNLNTGTYTLSLSTTSQPVNGLDLVTLDNNLGSDNQAFTVSILGGGAVPSVLSFSGTPFLYNPSVGNLLLDIRITDIAHSGNEAFFDARSGTAAGIFSRAHDFGDGFEDFGLVTEFDGSAVPEPTTVGLLGLGLITGAIRRRRERS
jgi:PEP-CTERM motif-containing protein